LRQKLQSDAQVEDSLRTELIEQGKKMNELRVDHETTLYEKMTEAGLKEESALEKQQATYNLELQQLRD
jgi:hypothetical protein